MAPVTQRITGYIVFLGEEEHVGDPDECGTAATVGEEEWRLFWFSVGWGLGKGDEEFERS